MFKVVCLCKGCDGCCVFCLWSFRCSCMGSVSVSSCSCCVLCASCGSSQYRVLHYLQFINAGRGYKRRPYRIGILQDQSHDCFIAIHQCFLLFTPSCCGEYLYYL